MYVCQSGRLRLKKTLAVPATIILAFCLCAAFFWLLSGRGVTASAAAPPLRVTNQQQEQEENRPNLDIVPQTLSPARGVNSYDWGDVDGDGDLDLAVGTFRQGNQVYLNQNGEFTELIWSDNMETNNSTAIAWGDVDGDGDLDLAVGLSGAPNRLYVNENGLLQTSPAWTDNLDDPTSDLLWADMNGDGFLDLVVANRGANNKIFLNSGSGMLVDTAAWQDPGRYDLTTSVDVADMDLDGDLDLVLGNYSNDRSYNPTNPIPVENYFTKIYRSNLLETGRFEFEEDWVGGTAVNDVTWGDLDQDGYPELALVDFWNFGFDGIYPNRSGVVSEIKTWTPRSEREQSRGRLGYSVAWGDVDKDGDLDLALGFSTDTRERVYQNINGRLEDTPIWESSSFERGFDIGWADIDRDNDLDLTVIYAGRVHVYRNHTWPLTPQSTRLDFGQRPSSLAWGDMDNDGDLDLAVGAENSPLPVRRTIYRQDGDEYTLLELSGNLGQVTGMAWGDVNGDGWLDLAVGQYLGSNLIYINENGTFAVDGPVYDLGDQDGTRAIAWGDVNGDGWLDLAVGNRNTANRIYINQEGAISATEFFTVGAQSATESLAWGDVDADGDLDLAVGNIGQPNQLYINDHGVLSDDRVQTFGQTENSNSLVWGDVNSDGRLDLVVGNGFQTNQLYLNIGGRLQDQPAWISGDLDDTRGVALGDVDGDGDLDLAAANASGEEGAAPQANRLYLNEDGQFQTVNDNPWTTIETDPSYAVAWGDADSDGDLDLVFAGLSGLDFYTNDRVPAHPSRPNIDISLSFIASPSELPDGSQSEMLAPTYFYGSAGRRESGRITFNYTLNHFLNQPVAFIRGFYSLDGGGQWQEAVPTSDTRITNLSTLPGENTHAFTWDVFSSGMIGQSDQVVFRLEATETIPGNHALPAGTIQYANQKAGVHQLPYVSATSLPFQVRGNQIRVFADGEEEANAASGSLVFRISEQAASGRALADQAFVPYTTDSNGYLQGRTQLAPTDQLVAMWPVPAITPLITFTQQAHLYYLSASPTISGLDSLTVGELNGEFPLMVNEQQPILLFDLIISLEWDASDDEIFMLELEESIRRASELLFDVTNGQIALGRVDIFHAKSNWNAADVVIYADNSLRPSAAIGGIVNSTVRDRVISPTKTIDAYQPGQIKMGPSWDPFRLSNNDFGEDWWQALAHELAHYLLFLPDNYLGFKDGDILGRINCPLSFMTTTRDPGYTEFLTTGEWVGPCLDTLAQRTTGRNDWETVQKFYPMLRPPNDRFEGPRTLPLNVTRIVRWIPNDNVETLPTRIFEIRNAADERLRLPQANVYLIRTQNNDDPTDDLLIYLGKPTAGGDRIKVRGAFANDRLCLFDNSSDQPLASCINPLSAEDVAFRVRPLSDATWQPEITVRPETTRTIRISVTQDLAPGEQLHVQVYPGHYRSVTGLAPTAIMNRTGNTHFVDIVMPLPAYDVSVRVWVDDDSRREAVRRFFVRIPWGPNDTLLGGQEGAPLGGPNDTPLGGPNDTPLGGPNDTPLGGPNDTPLGGPNDTPLGGPNDTPLGGPNDTPLGGPNDTPLGGPNDTPLGGPNDTPLGGPNDTPLGGIDNRALSAPILSADAQVVVYNRNGFFEPNGVEALQLLGSVPYREAFPWLVPVGPAYEVTLDPAITDERIMAITYLQRDVPEGYEHTVNIYFLPAGESTWQRLETRREIENLVVADLIPQDGAYAVMATMELPAMQPGWNLLAYPLPVTRSVTATLASISGSYSLVYEASAADLASTNVLTRPETITALVNTNVRQGPGINKPWISYLLAGETATIHGQDPVSGWWLIECPARVLYGTTCWISNSPTFVQVSGSSYSTGPAGPGSLTGQSAVEFFQFGYGYWVFITAPGPVTPYLAPPVQQPDGQIR